MSGSYWLAFGIACLSACGTEPDDFARCTGGMDIVVSPAAQPEFTWTPSGCLVNEIAVDGPSGRCGPFSIQIQSTGSGHLYVTDSPRHLARRSLPVLAQVDQR